MNWLDGQQRRAWLDAIDQKAGNALNYYLGPAAAPLNALAQFGAMLSPGADMVDMQQSGSELMGASDWRGRAMAVGGLGAAALGVAVPGTARGISEVGENAFERIRAYHGSPHDFDRFDASKIGTGEGAQAYGHGLYFAENEDVARSYRDKLAKTDLFTPEGTADVMVRDWGREEALRRIGETAPGAFRDKVVARIENGETAPAGRMYEVNINADPAKFVDYDAPISQQPEELRAVLSRWAGAIGLDPDTAQAKQVLGLAQSPEGAAKLKEAGAAGIKYRDAGSRNGGEGSRNFVVFDDKTIEILRKYGLLAGAGIGASYAASQGSAEDGI